MHYTAVAYIRDVSVFNREGDGMSFDFYPVTEAIELLSTNDSIKATRTIEAIELFEKKFNEKTL